MTTISARLEREREHAQEILLTEEKNWNWHTPAGKIRFERRVQFLGEALGPEARQSARVVEIGAGTGTYSGRLAEAYPNLVATDISPDLLMRAKQRFPHITFEVMDAHELTVENDSLDAVVGCSVLHHLEWGRAVREYYRVLKPGGVVRFSEPNLMNPQIFLQKSIPFLKRLAGDSPDEYAFTRFEIAKRLSQAGFSQIVVKPFEFLHPAVPEKLIQKVVAIEKFLESCFMREIGGSILIEARK
jgi:ubiquinone/menaquinone biosynthesis C-methylase UbiE